MESTGRYGDQLKTLGMGISGKYYDILGLVENNMRYGDEWKVLGDRD